MLPYSKQTISQFCVMTQEFNSLHTSTCISLQPLLSFQQLSGCLLLCSEILSRLICTFASNIQWVENLCKRKWSRVHALGEILSHIPPSVCRRCQLLAKNGKLLGWYDSLEHRYPGCCCVTEILVLQ